MAMLRIVALADLHGQLPELPACDLLILAGDICPDNRYTLQNAMMCAAAQEVWLRTVFASWLGRQEARTKLIIWGNHDFIGEHSSLWPRLDALIVREGRFLIESLWVYGSSYVTDLPQWALNRSSAEDSAHWGIAPDCDLLVTHSPAFGTGDEVPGAGHVGSRGLEAYVARVNPRLHVFGHIHEGRGGNVQRYNVSYVDGAYKPYPLPIPQFELEV